MSPPMMPASRPVPSPVDKSLPLPFIEPLFVELPLPVVAPAPVVLSVVPVLAPPPWEFPGSVELPVVIVPPVTSTGRFTLSRSIGAEVVFVSLGFGSSFFEHAAARARRAAAARTLVDFIDFLRWLCCARRVPKGAGAAAITAADCSRRAPAQLER